MNQETLPEIDDDQKMLLAIVLEDKLMNYRPGFYHWLLHNYEIWKRFVAEADKLRALGRPHYSARTIIEYLRHETMLRDGTEYKVNNNAAPSLARLYMAVRGCPGFFELREPCAAFSPVG